MVTTTVRFPDELMTRAKIACAIHKTSIQQLCAEGLEIRVGQLEIKLAGAKGKK